ncbi:hypothetical protein [Peribacillus simplex]|uniref:hypothetical protein n=1 Tax=Peribacillus simplex TaxID=1478 RepID=UPI003D2787A2
MKRLMMAALLALLIIQTTNLVKAETKTSCEITQFKIVLKSAADVKEKASASSKTLKTYKKNKELSASGRTGDWYKVCRSKKTAYINMADVKEVFSTDEKALLKKFDRRKGVNQVLSVTGKAMIDKKVTIQTYEKKQGEWRRALKKMEGVIGVENL